MVVSLLKLAQSTLLAYVFYLIVSQQDRNALVKSNLLKPTILLGLVSLMSMALNAWSLVLIKNPAKKMKAAVIDATLAVLFGYFAFVINDMTRKCQSVDMSNFVEWLKFAFQQLMAMKTPSTGCHQLARVSHVSALIAVLYVASSVASLVVPTRAGPIRVESAKSKKKN